MCLAPQKYSLSDADRTRVLEGLCRSHRSLSPFVWIALAFRNKHEREVYIQTPFPSLSFFLSIYLSIYLSLSNPILSIFFRAFLFFLRFILFFLVLSASTCLYIFVWLFFCLSFFLTLFDYLWLFLSFSSFISIVFSVLLLSCISFPISPAICF